MMCLITHVLLTTMEENELFEVNLGSTSSRGGLMLLEVHQSLFLTATATSHNMHLLCMYFKVDHTFVSCGNVVMLLDLVLL